MDEALQAAEQACEGWVDPAPIARAREILAAPWRIALVGRVAAGKSTLVNAITGSTTLPTGLGGVTVDSVEVHHGDLVLVDTPGIDDPDAAVVGLPRVLDGVDAVLWVVDGLQPMTASERDVLDLVLPPGLPLKVVVSKRDLLDASDVDSVIGRCRALSGAEVRCLDLRAAEREGFDPGDLAAPERPGPRRAAAIAALIDEVRAALEQVPRPPDLDTILAVWTSEVRAATAAIEREIDDGTIRHKTDALAALGGRKHQAVAALRRALGPTAPPRLPAPDAPSTTMVGQVLAGLSGAEGARRLLKAGAARWLAEGQLVLREWWLDEVELQESAASRRRLEEALARARESATVSA